MLKKIPLSEQAYHELVKRIIAGKWPGGTRLAEEALSREFGISRTPIREALKRLAGEEMIETLPGGGFRVGELDRLAVAELFDCRTGIEVLALSAAIDRIPAEKLTALQVMLTRTGTEAECRRYSLAGDEALHELIATYCGNRYLAQTLRQLIKRTAPFRHYRNENPTPDLTAERVHLVAAILARDRNTAAALLAQHINGATAAIPLA